MATYLMADIHGDWDRYSEMKSLIRFSDLDKLIIIGDVIDRGDYGIKILQDVMNSKNIKMLMGNHELMLLQADIFNDNPTKSVKELRDVWTAINGGYTTIKALYDLPDHGKSIVEYVKTLKVIAKTKSADGRRFALVHGWSPDSENLDDCEFMEQAVWGRPQRCSIPKFDRSKYDQLVVGHTPVRNFYTDNECEEHELNSIFHAPHFINIDCGCGHSNRSCRLGCLCIDTMEEFYV